MRKHFSLALEYKGNCADLLLGKILGFYIYTPVWDKKLNQKQPILHLQIKKNMTRLGLTPLMLLDSRNSLKGQYYDLPFVCQLSVSLSVDLTKYPANQLRSLAIIIFSHNQEKQSWSMIIRVKTYWYSDSDICKVFFMKLFSKFASNIFFS